MPKRGHGRAEKEREDHDLQDFVARHGIEDAHGKGVLDEAAQRHGALGDAGRCPFLWDRQLQGLAGLEDLHQDQSQQQRDERGHQEAGKRLAADPTGRAHITHAGDAGHQSRQHQRRDDHLDEAQEGERQQIQRIGKTVPEMLRGKTVNTQAE